MADMNKRGPDCDDCESGEGGERGERGERGKRGPRGHDGRDGRDGSTGPTGPAAATGATGPAATEGPPFTAPFPDQAPVEVTIYARSAAEGGSDATGDGSLGAPYETFKRAVRDVPHFIDPGFIYTVDVTGIGTEPFPADYELPAVFAPNGQLISEEFGGPTPLPFPFGSSYNIRAFPQPATSIVPDVAIPASDIVGVTQDPVTNLVTFEIQPARVSWAADGAKGTFLIFDGQAFASSVVYASENVGPSSFLSITNAVVPAITDATLMEPSATFATTNGIYAFNNPQVAYQGIRFTTTQFFSLFHSGGNAPVATLCDIDGLSVAWIAGGFLSWANVIRNVLGGDGAAFQSVGSLNLNCFIFNDNAAGNQWDSSVNDGCTAMGSIPFAAFAGGGTGDNGWEFVDCYFKNGVDPKGAVWGNGCGTYSLQNVKIDNQVGDALTVEGQAYMFLQTVGGTGNGGVGLRVNDGGFARLLDELTNITGSEGDMKAGIRPVRDWGTAPATPPGNFYFDAPIRNEYDISFPIVGDTLVGGPILAVSNAAPIAITTTVAHGLSDGSQVKISGTAPNTAAEGFWTVTVTGANSFELNGSDGTLSGVYVAGGTTQTANGGTSGSRIFMRPF